MTDFNKKYDTGLGESLDNAITRLDAFLSDGAIEFIAGLWDPEIGGFYYSQSGRDYKGFSPNINSTCQIVQMLSLGFIKGLKGSLHEKLPKDIVDKLLAFSTNTGPCEKVMKEKLGLLPATKSSMKGWAGVKPAQPKKYRDVYEVIDLIDNVFSFKEPVTKLEEELVNIKNSSLLNEMFDYLDRIAFKKSDGKRLAEETSRIGLMYNSEGRVILERRKLIERIVELILSDECSGSNVRCVCSAWAALKVLLQNTDYQDNGDKADMYSYVRSRVGAMIDKTIEILSVFKKSDGGYSYYPNYAPNEMSGKRVALGISEGDVNATFVVLHGVRGNVFLSLGLTVPPLLPEESFTELVDMMHSAKPIKKRRIPLKHLIKKFIKRLKA
ncbi:MAG: hypothetical protein IJW03_04320 [Clostridia bacterium]|nr:hypothetical protein [Clostridia bacterium]